MPPFCDYVSFPAEFVRDDVFRPLDWRWERAIRWSLRSDRAAWHEEDSWTQEAATVLRPRPAWFRPGLELKSRIQRVVSARGLYEWDFAQKTVLDAWLLTRASYDEIGDHLQVPVETIDWYERLFFDIRDRHHVGEVMMSKAIGRQPVAGRLRAAWVIRWLAYFGGQVVLEAALPFLGSFERKAYETTAEVPRELQALIDTLMADWNPVISADLLAALQPMWGSDSPTGPDGSGWRSDCHSQPAAAPEAVAAPHPAGHFHTA